MKRIVYFYLRPYRAALAFALAQVFLISALELLKPWPVKIIIDHVLSDNPLPFGFSLNWSRETLLVVACTGLVLVYLILGGMRVLNDYTTIRIGQAMVNDLRRDFYSQLQRLSLSFHHRRHVGDLLYRLTSDTYAIQTLTMNGLFPVLCSLTLFAGMLLVMIRLDRSTAHISRAGSVSDFSGPCCRFATTRLACRFRYSYA